MKSLRCILPAVEEASRIALQFFRKASIGTAWKPDGSLVTDADLAVDELLIPAILSEYPTANVVSEERQIGQFSPDGATILVDPIDGTSAFASGIPGFCISVGVVMNGQPVAGVVAAPAWGITWICDFDPDSPVLRGGLPLSRATSLRPFDRQTTVLVDSKLHHRYDLGTYAGRCRSFGSTALHLCLVADNEAFSVAHTGRVYPWDVAGAHAIATRVGLKAELVSGGPMMYDSCLPDQRLPDDILLGHPNHIEAFRAYMRQRIR